MAVSLEDDIRRVLNQHSAENGSNTPDYILAAYNHAFHRHEFAKKQPAVSLEDDIRRVLNQHSAENGSNTPDYILAAYLMACLDAFDDAVRRRVFAREGEREATMRGSNVPSVGMALGDLSRKP